MPVRCVLVALLTALGLASGSADAAVRSGAADDPLEFQHPSLDGRLTTEAVHATATYDDETGTVTASLTYNAPPDFGQAGGTFTLSRCDRGVSPRTGRPAGPTPPELTIYADGVLDYARLEGFDGTAPVAIAISDEGRTVTASASHVQFAHRDWRCVDAEGDTGDYDTDEVSFLFSGLSPLPLDAGAATAVLQDALARRYPADWAASQQRWVLCPPQETFRRSGGEDPYASCRFELRSPVPGAVLGGGAEVEVQDLTYLVGFFSVHRYDKRQRDCPRSRFSNHTYANGIQIVNRRMRSSPFFGCDSLVASDIDYSAHLRFPSALRQRHQTWIHGTGTAGFEAQLRFSCRVRSRLHGATRSYALRCHNRLGDGYAYRFDARRKPRRPRPRPPAPATPACNPSYADVCLPLDRDVDCGDISAHDFPVLGSDPYRLDGDGDGIACES